MVFGMSTACFFPEIFTERSLALMSEMRVKNIEVFFSCMSEYQKNFVKDLKKRALDSGITVYSVHALSLQFEPQLFSAHARARQEAEDIMKQVLEAAAELDAGVYVFHGPANLKRSRKLALNYDHIAQTAGRLADTAKSYGVKLAWENVHWCWYAEPEFASKLLEMPGMDNIYFTLDIKQAAQAGFEPADFIHHTKGRLVNVHICDHLKNDEREITPVLPFRGCMDFYALRTALEKAGYDGGIILEVYSSNYKDYDELKDNYYMLKSFFDNGKKEAL